jgi:outer membrane protein assembly factor BamB
VKPALLKGALASCALVVVACGGQAVSASGASSASSPGTTSAVTAPASDAAVPSGDWLQFGDDAQSSGSPSGATGITAGNVGRLSLRAVTVDGVADSSAIEIADVRVGDARHDLVAVTTTYGKTIAIDPATGRRLWEFDPPGVTIAAGNPQVTTASPVADPHRAYVYSASPDGYIHKLSVATGHQLWRTRVTFDPAHEKLASALRISGNWVVVVTGGYIGDAPPYDGHVVMIDRATGRIAHVWNTECSERHRLIRASSCSVTNTRGDNAIWGRAGAVIEPGNGRLLVATGNGPFNGTTSWGDSVLELSPDAGRLLHNWTPSNQSSLAGSDTDLGSSSPAILPVFHGRRLAVQGGKDGKLHLLDLDRLDGTTGGASGRLGGELSETSSPGGGQVLPQPAVWTHGGRIYLFSATGSGTGAYQLVDAAHPHLVSLWENGTGGTSPVIAGGLVYVFDPGGHIDIRRPLTGAVVRVLPAGSGHWNSPIVVGGRVIEPTGAYATAARSSTIDIYHLPGR